MPRLHGSCHCGNLNVEYTTEVAAEDTAVRACQCSFCRKHDARAVSDPKGTMAIAAGDASLLERYTFELGETEFMVCRKCGVYVGAYMADGDDAYANVMVNVLDDRTAFPEPRPVDLDGEDGPGKRQRRRDMWTPATLTLGTPRISPGGPP